MGVTPAEEDDKTWLGDAMASQLAFAIEENFSEDSERRKRHAALLKKWPVIGLDARG